MAPVDSPEILARFHSALPIVNGIAAQLRRDIGNLLQFDEMLSFGQEGLLTAARRYDPDRGVPFRKFAYYRVRGAILDGMRAEGPVSRRYHEKIKALQSANLIASGFYEDNAAAVAGGISAEAADERLSDQLAVLATAMALGTGDKSYVKQDGEHVPIATDCTESKVEISELMQIVEAELENLSQQEALFIRRHFLEDENIDAIASELGLSKSWGSRILGRGLMKLSKRMQACC